MIKPQIPANENERLKELLSYSVLDSLSEKDFDNLTAIASEICDTPISLVSLIDSDRQWFKSHHGLAAQQTPKEYAFCAHAINEPQDVLIVQDSRQDQRFYDNPLVTGEPNVIFYAGVPLVTENGFPLGTLCVIDNEPRLLSQSQIKSLSALGNQVMNLLELRKKKLLLQEAVFNLEERNVELERFAYIAAHDLKSPLNNISGLTNLLALSYADSLPEEGQNFLKLIESSSLKLKKMVDGLLSYSRNSTILNETKVQINVEELVQGVEALFAFDSKCKIELKADVFELFSNRTALEQILINLISNAIKYSDKEFAQIEISVSEDELFYKFYVLDNGPGIDPEQQDKIFEIFKVVAEKDRFGEAGNGIGLATVKKMVLALGGIIHVESEKGKGAKFVFDILKS